MSQSINPRLYLLMFFQYAVMGAYMPVYANYLRSQEDGLGLSAQEIGFLFCLGPAAGLLTPLIAGYLADKHISCQRLLGMLLFICGISLLVMSHIRTFTGAVVMMSLFAFMHAPTVSLANTISFTHIGPIQRHRFSLIRLWGTLGWMASGLLLSGWRMFGYPSIIGDLFIMAGSLAILQAVFAYFVLPDTPPTPRPNASPYRFFEAFALFTRPSFAILMAVLFFANFEFDFCYILTGPFLESQLGISKSNLPAWMTLNQLIELGVMFFLPWILSTIGIRYTIILGLLGWALRFGIFAIGTPAWLVLASMTMHGVGYVCVFVSAYIYIDQVSPPHLKASAQSLLTWIALGWSRFFSSNLTGWLTDRLSGPDGTQWTFVFLIPMVLMIVCSLVLLVAFRPSIDEHPHY